MGYYADILFTASVYKSAPSALRFINTIHHLRGNHLAVLVAPLDEDISYLVEHPVKNTVIFKTTWDNMYAGRNWGFLWARQNGVYSQFYCSCDDDLEFLPDSYDILDRLKACEYSVMTFLNGSHLYQGFGGEMVGECRKVGWLNGDSMFSHTEDNLLYGLPDCLRHGSPMPYFVESEYQQRMCALSGKPVIADIGRVRYIHHHRDDPVKTAIRTAGFGEKMRSGMQFFQTKYPGAVPAKVDVNRFDFHTATRRYIQSNPTAAQRHLLYDGLWLDYDKMYEQHKGVYTLIYDGR